MVGIGCGLGSHLLLLLLQVAGKGATLPIQLGFGSPSGRPVMQAKLAFVALIDGRSIFVAQKGQAVTVLALIGLDYFDDVLHFVDGHFSG